MTSIKRLALLSILVAACGGTDPGDTPDAASGDGGMTPDGPGGPDGGGPPDASSAPDGTVVVPDAATTSGNIGDPCLDVAECLGNYCASEAVDGLPGGYCTFIGCDLGMPDTSCLPFGGDGACIAVDATTNVCLDQCDPAASDCRVGYTCQPFGGYNVCFPGATCGNGMVEAGEECDPPDAVTCDAACQAIGGGPIGDPCVSGADCLGNFCIPDADGWPMGYCTQFPCDPADPIASCAAFGGDGYCLPAGMTEACFDQCASPADCRAGYQCQPLGMGLGGVCTPAPAMPVCGDGVVDAPEECEPPGTPSCDAMCMGTGTLPIGDPCADAGECAGNTCIAMWPSGYCADTTCDPADPTASCAPFGGDGYCLTVGGGSNVCFDECATVTDCRAGYQCQNVGPTSVCTPLPVCGDGTVDPPEECEPPGTPSCDAMCVGTGTLPVGDPCLSAGDCAGDTCIEDASGWPMGYCADLGCDLADPVASCAPAGGDGTCVDAGGTPVCLDECTPGPGACRVGYTCMNIGMGTSVCAPT